MTDELLDLIKFLENDLSAFYSSIKNLHRTKIATDVLEYMEMHSSAHAEVIEKTKNKYEQPKFKKELIKNFQENLKKSIHKQIMDERDLGKESGRWCYPVT